MEYEKLDIPPEFRRSIEPRLATTGLMIVEGAGTLFGCSTEMTTVASGREVDRPHGRRNGDKSQAAFEMKRNQMVLVGSCIWSRR